MRFAYADPPYRGQAKRHYSHDPLCAEVDHVALIRRLNVEFPDGWALSLSSPSIPYVAFAAAVAEDLLSSGPIIADATIGEISDGLRERGYRWSSWVKPFAPFKVGVNPSYSWEPILWKGGRRGKERGGREVPTQRDWSEDGEPTVRANVALKKGLVGAKPEAFSFFIFDLLGMRADDEFHDLFSGTGGVMRAWESWRAAKATVKDSHDAP